MATDLERLVVSLEASIKSYEKELARSTGIATSTTNAIDRQFKGLQKKIEASMEGAAKSVSEAFNTSSLSGLTGVLGGISGALATNEIIQYADAWTKAKNALAVVGVTGDNQKIVLDELYASAQKNAAPLDALVTLYGRASQAAQGLGANQDQLLKFSDGVATALKVAGAGAEESSGALLQLSQLLASGTVHAEEFNSVNEAALPILQSVARGITSTGGSVAKLRAMVLAGTLTSKQFFDGFLKGLPELQAQAASSTTTVEQGFIKIKNALTKFIGETDSGLGASARLAAGLGALADNFDHVADVALKFASVIAAALVGRSIAGMIVSLGSAAGALLKFTQAMAAARTAGGLTAALGGLGAAAGPIGAIIGVAAAGAMLYFSSTTAEASAAADTYTEALRRAREEGAKAPASVTGAADGLVETARNRLAGGVDFGKKQMDDARDAAVALLTQFDEVDSFKPDGVTSELSKIRDELNDGTLSADQAQEALSRLANANGKDFQGVADSMAPLLRAIRDATAATHDLINAQRELTGVAAPAGITGSERTEPTDRARSSVASDYIAQQEKLNALSKTEFDLRTETLKVQKEAAAVGKTLGYDEAQRLARDNLAAKDKRKEEAKTPKSAAAPKVSADDRFDINADKYAADTAAILAQIPLLTQSAFAREKAAQMADLESAALEKLRRAKGTDAQLSTEQKATLEAEATARAAATVKLQEAKKALDDLHNVEQAFGDLGLTVFDNLIDGSKTFKESIEDLLKSLAKMVLQAALLGTGPLASLFSTGAKSTGGTGGLFGAALSLIPGLAEGGYTGNGGKYQPAGLVHKGEYVFDAETTRKIGPQNLEAFRNSIKGYANGGLVGSTASISPMQAYRPRNDNGVVNVPISIDARGATRDAIPALQIELVKLRRDVPAIIADARKRRML